MILLLTIFLACAHTQNANMDESTISSGNVTKEIAEPLIEADLADNPLPQVVDINIGFDLPTERPARIARGASYDGYEEFVRKKVPMFGKSLYISNLYQESRLQPLVDARLASYQGETPSLEVSGDRWHVFTVSRALEKELMPVDREYRIRLCEFREHLVAIRGIMQDGPDAASVTFDTILRADPSDLLRHYRESSEGSQCRQAPRKLERELSLVRQEGVWKVMKIDLATPTEP